MALTKVSGGILDPGINVAGVVTATGFSGPFIGGGGINAGVVTATGFDLNGNGDISGNLVIGGNLTANGDFTTLNTTLREVELLRVDANSSVAAGIITQTGAGDLLRLYDGTSQVVTVDDEGNIGIGRATPTAELDVIGSGRFIKTSNNYILVGSSNAGGAAIVLDGDSNGDGSGTDYAYIEHDSSGNLNIVATNPSDNSQMVFNTGDGSEVLRIKADGKLGINYNNPVTIIHALGNSNVGTSVTMTLQSHDTANATSGLNLLARRNDNVNETCKIQAASGGQNSVDLQFHTNSGEKLRITSAGNVGIGSAIPSQLLDVAGTIKTANITSNSSNLSIENTADRVLIKSANRVDIADNMIRFQNRAQNAALLEAVAGASGYVKLYHNNNVVASVTMDALTVTGRTNNSGMIEIASGQAANNNDRFRIHKTSAASRLTIQNYSTGSWVENIRITAGGAVELKHADGTTKLETTSAGSKISGNLELSSTYPSLTWTDTNHNSDFRITNDDGKLIVYDISRGEHVLDFLANGDLHVRGDKGIYFGESNDLLVGHDGSSTRIDDNFGYLNIRSNHLELKSTTGSELYANFKLNGSAKLYYDGTERFATSGIGVTVTGEIAASQDYPNFRPTIDFNFAAEKKLDPRITCQRTGTASFTDEFGKVVFVGDNEPRFDHDPDTGECKGLLIEESRTNIAPYTDLSEFSGYNITKTANNAVAPDGTTTAAKIEHGGSGTSYLDHINTSINAQNAGPYTYSVWLKAPDDQPDGYYGCRIAVLHSTGGNVEPTVSLNKTWTRYTVTKTFGASDGGNLRVHPIMFRASPGSTYDGKVIPSYVWAWGAQIEAGAFSTSYIPDAGATRGYEAVTLEGTDFSDVFRTEFNEFSLVADYDNTQTNDGTNYAIVSLWGEATGYDDRIEWFKLDSSPYHIETRSFGGGNPIFVNGELSASSKAKAQRFATSWSVPEYSNTSTRRFAISMGGEAVDVVNDSSGSTVPQITRMGIGCNPTRLDFSPGLLHFKRLMVYNKTLSDGQLQNLSAQ